MYHFLFIFVLFPIHGVESSNVGGIIAFSSIPNQENKISCFNITNEYSCQMNNCTLLLTDFLQHEYVFLKKGDKLILHTATHTFPTGSYHFNISDSIISIKRGDDNIKEEVQGTCKNVSSFSALLKTQQQALVKKKEYYSKVKRNMELMMNGMCWLSDFVCTTLGIFHKTATNMYSNSNWQLGHYEKAQQFFDQAF